jgi:hypothetical protein
VGFERCAVEGAPARLVDDGLPRAERLDAPAQQQLGIERGALVLVGQQLGRELRAMRRRREDRPAALDQAPPAQIDVLAVGSVEADDVDDGPLGGSERLDELPHLRQRLRGAGDLEAAAVEDIALRIDRQQGGRGEIGREVGIGRHRLTGQGKRYSIVDAARGRSYASSGSVAIWRGSGAVSPGA